MFCYKHGGRKQCNGREPQSVWKPTHGANYCDIGGLIEMTAKVDRRVARTRQALQGALVELILDKGYEAISVQDIVDRANIGRSTFYMHYSCKDAVFFDSFGALEMSLRAALEQDHVGIGQGGERRLRYSGLLFAHVGNRRQLYRALAGQRGGVLAAGRIRKILFDLVRRDFDSRRRRDGVCDTTCDGAVHFVVGAIIEVLTWWLECKTHWSSDEVDRFLASMIAPGLAAVFADGTGPRPDNSREVR